jgi:hypothetical protein
MYGIFDHMTRLEEEGSIFTVVKVSFLEIYNEKINDLLDNNVYIVGVSVEEVQPPCQRG